MGYYYLMASLPTVSLGAPPPLTSAAFRMLCASQLSRPERDALAELDAVESEAPARDGFVRAWRDRETQLRNAVARLRAVRPNRDAAPALRSHGGFDAYTEKAAADAFREGNPLERELALDRCRWRAIEELAGLDSFSGRAVLAYALKLRLAERWAAMDPARGRTRQHDIVGRAPALAAGPGTEA